jgi:hypothetical protein
MWSQGRTRVIGVIFSIIMEYCPNPWSFTSPLIEKRDWVSQPIDCQIPPLPCNLHEFHFEFVLNWLTSVDLKSAHRLCFKFEE